MSAIVEGEASLLYTLCLPGAIQGRGVVWTPAGTAGSLAVESTTWSGLPF